MTTTRIKYPAFGASIAIALVLWLSADARATAADALAFGADISGKRDSSVAISAGWNAIRKGQNGGVAGKLDFPCGIYRIANTMVLASAYMGRFEGEGGCTQFIWVGDSNSPMFLVQDCFRCDFGNFRVLASPAHPLRYAIQSANSGKGGIVSTATHFHNIEVEGNSALYTGIEINGAVDANNDQQVFRDVAIFGYTHSAWTLGSETKGFNIFDVVMEHCTFSGRGAPYGVETLHGNFHWLYGDGGGNSIADFYFATLGAGGYDIVGGHFEASSSFIRTGGPAGISAVVRVENVTWGGECLGNSAADIQAGCPKGPAGGEAVQWRYLGPIVIRSSQFGEVAPSNLTMDMGLGGGVIEDSIFATTNTTVESLIVGKGVERFSNNSYLDRSGRSHAYDVEILHHRPVVEQ